MEWKIKFMGIFHQWLLPALAFRPRPASDSTLINRQLGIGNHFLLGDPQYSSIAFTALASPVGIIVIKKLRLQVRKLNSIQGKAVIKALFLPIQALNDAGPTTFHEGRVNRIRHATRIFLILLPNHKTIDQYAVSFLVDFCAVSLQDILSCIQGILNILKPFLAGCSESRISLL